MDVYNEVIGCSAQESASKFQDLFESLANMSCILREASTINPALIHKAETRIKIKNIASS